MTPPRQRFATTPPQLSSRTQPKSSATVHGTNDVLVVAAAGRGEAEAGGGADGEVELFATCSGVAVMKPHHPAAPDCFGTTRIVSHRPMPLVLVYQRGSGRNGLGGGPLVMLCQGPVGPSASAKKIDWPGPATRSLSDQSTSHLPVLGFCQTHLPSNSWIWDSTRYTHADTARMGIVVRAPRAQLIGRVVAALQLAWLRERVEHIALIGPMHAIRARRIGVGDPAPRTLTTDDIVHVPRPVVDLAPGPGQRNTVASRVSQHSASCDGSPRPRQHPAYQLSQLLRMCPALSGLGVKIIPLVSAGSTSSAVAHHNNVGRPITDALDGCRRCATLATCTIVFSLAS